MDSMNLHKIPGMYKFIPIQRFGELLLNLGYDNSISWFDILLPEEKKNINYEDYEDDEYDEDEYEEEDEYDDEDEDICFSIHDYNDPSEVWIKQNNIIYDMRGYNILVQYDIETKRTQLEFLLPNSDRICVFESGKIILSEYCKEIEKKELDNVSYIMRKHYMKNLISMLTETNAESEDHLQYLWKPKQ